MVISRSRLGSGRVARDERGRTGMYRDVSGRAGLLGTNRYLTVTYHVTFGYERCLPECDELHGEKFGDGVVEGQ